MYKTVRVREETYRKLNELAAALREKLGRPVSLDEVIRRLIADRGIERLAGSWEMDSKEEMKIRKAIEELRSRWKPRTA
ncbi:MAG: hypothetical protein C0200_01640, partial [Thermoproteota archaeon]